MGEHLLLTGQALTLHGVLIVDRKLDEELPAALQRSIRPRDRTLAFRDELHVPHGLMGTRPARFNATAAEAEDVSAQMLGDLLMNA